MTAIIADLNGNGIGLDEVSPLCVPDGGAVCLIVNNEHPFSCHGGTLLSEEIFQTGEVVFLFFGDEDHLGL